MDLEREQRFHHLLAKALDREPGERRRFLDAACDGDRDLLEEVLRAASADDDALLSFLDRPALAKSDETRIDRSTGGRASGPRGASSSTTPPTSLLARLRATPGVSVFLLLVVAAPALIGAAATGAAAMMSAAHVGLGFSSLNGRVRYLSEQWTGVHLDDEIVAIDGVDVGSDPERIRAALLEIEPGPVVVRFRRDGREWEVAAAATPHTWVLQLVTWTRVATGALLLAIGAFSFILRPGSRVTWLFLAFCTALSVHLLSYMALLAHPPVGIVVEGLGFYLAAATGLHLFTAFPTLLFRRRLWAAGFYLPALAAALVLVPLYREPSAYALVANTLRIGSIVAAVAAAGAAVLLVLQFLRARRAADAIAQARSRALLVAVAFGLVAPAVLGAVQVVHLDLDWAVNSFLVSIFVVMTAYSIVRHNALEVDRFTAAILGYAATTVVLAAGFGAVVVGVPALLGTAGPLRSPWTSAAITAAFFALFSPLYRRIRRRVDRWYLRERVEDDTAMRLLRQVADSVRTGELSETFRVGLETAMVLHADRAELWTRSPDGSFARCCSGSGDSSSARVPPIPEDSPLALALAAGSGGVHGLVDRPLTPAAQQELWSRELVLAAPVVADDRLHGFVALGRKKSGIAYTRRERAFVDTLASHLGIAVERGWSAAERLGPYRILERLGTGGMAEVYLAEKQGPGGFELRVAMKRILPHLAQDPGCVAMFLDEARIAAQLRHPHIVRIHDIEELEGTYFLAMEYMDGPTLDALIRSAAGRQEGLPLPVVAAMTSSVLSALHYAHRKKDRRGQPLGLVHRDVKPGNILLSREGEIKLTDFGIARAEFRLYQTLPGHSRGTPAYMAPEQQLGGDVGPAADLFSTGAVIYEALTGRRAFPSGPRRVEPIPMNRLDPGLPRTLDDFARRALAEDPARRFATAAEMRAAFLAAIAPVVPATADEVAAAVASFVPATDYGKIGPRSRSGSRWRPKTAATLRNF